MADRLPEKDTSSLETRQIGQEIESMVKLVEGLRKANARHWYDNNFFDDGHHYRFVSRATGRIIDLSEQASLYTPKRAIPKASRQIRGMANLILSADFIPVVRPEKVMPYSYPDPMVFQQMFEQAKEIAKKRGYFLQNEWKDQDLDIKLAMMVVLTMKHSVSYLEIWPDAIEEKIRTAVFDAFDIYLMPNYTEIEDSPFLIKAIPKTIREIKANENFDQKQLERITPDNRYASDEIKEAYLASKFGKEGRPSDSAATLIEKEAFLTEYLSDDNWKRASKDSKETGALEGKSKGDKVIRQVFVAGQVTLYDKYVNLSSYPFVDFRMEPGPIYQTPQIERFIPQNKSLDAIVSRIERFIHTTDTGVWLKRRGENFKISNVAGGLIAEYDTTPPAQMPITQLGNDIYNFANMLDSYIEEQGVTTSALGKIPKGIKAWGAIESLKASEFANLYINIKMIKKTIKKISEKMFEIADTHFVSPKPVYHAGGSEPVYFDVMGQKGIEVRNKIKEPLPEDIVPLKKDIQVEIEIESGLGYTDEGKKGRALEIANFMVQMAQAGLVTPDAAKLVVNRLLEIYKFGPTAEIMEAMDQAPQQTQQMPFTQDQNEQMKTNLLEVIADLQKAAQGGGQNADNINGPQGFG